MTTAVPDAVRRALRCALVDAKPEAGVPQLVSPQAVASAWGLNAATVRAWIRSGRLPAVRLGRVWRLRVDVLGQWLRDQAGGISSGSERARSPERHPGDASEGPCEKERVET